MSAHIRRAATIGAALLATALIGAGPAFAAPSAPPQPASPSQPTERAAAIARPAVVQLQQTFTGYVADETGDYFNEGNAYELSASCTGFGVDPNGYIATAGHCVDISSAIGVKSVSIGTVAAEVATRLPGVTLEEITEFGTSNWSVEGKQKDSPIDVAISVSVGGTELAARVVDVRPLDQGDVALLKVETTDLPTVELATDAAVQVGTPVLSIGYPASAGAVTGGNTEPSNKDGQISSKQAVGSVPVYETSAALTEGMSGGPSIGLDGRVLGINSFKPSGESQAFNFIAPATGLAELMARNGVRGEPGPNDRTYREALAHYYTGNYTTAIAGFDRLLMLVPEHQQAAEYRSRAAKAREQFGDAPVAPVPAARGILGVPWWATGIAAGVGLLVTTGIVLAARRRRGVVTTDPPAVDGQTGSTYPPIPLPRPATEPVPWLTGPAPGHERVGPDGRPVGADTD